MRCYSKALLEHAIITHETLTTVESFAFHTTTQRTPVELSPGFDFLFVCQTFITPCAHTQSAPRIILTISRQLHGCLSLLPRDTHSSLCMPPITILKSLMQMPSFRRSSFPATPSPDLTWSENPMPRPTHQDIQFSSPNIETKHALRDVNEPLFERDFETRVRQNMEQTSNTKTGFKRLLRTSSSRPSC